MITFNNQYTYHRDIIKLFQGGKYEQYVYSIMQKSKKIFPNQYKYITEQSHGECDFVDLLTDETYDVKLPFDTSTVELLTSGKNHEPKYIEWLESLLKSSHDFSMKVKNNHVNYDLSKSVLYKVIKGIIEKENTDENIIFFFPFPVVLSIKGSIFLQFQTDYLVAAFNQLTSENVLKGREIFAIYPSNTDNIFAVRNLKSANTEFIECTELGAYFIYKATL